MSLLVERVPPRLHVEARARFVDVREVSMSEHLGAGEHREQLHQLHFERLELLRREVVLGLVLLVDSADEADADALVVEAFDVGTDLVSARPDCTTPSRHTTKW
jgi:hypothetical protein